MKSRVSSTALLDLNIFVALAWPAHEHHAAAQQWFLNRGRSKWASCPITQLGFLRLLSNPAFSPDALSVRQALELLIKNVNQPLHEFWTDTISAPHSLKAFADAATGHQQVTDAYLLSLAVRHRARLATFDRGLAEFARQAEIGAHVELVSPAPARGAAL